MLALLKRSLIARRLLSARLLSVWGDTFYAMAAMWVTLAITGSAWRMALIALAEVLPYLLFSAVAGVLVDRWDRRRTLVTLDLIQGAVVAAVPVLYISGLFSPWQLPVVGFLLATCRSLYGPALTGYYSGTVSKEDLPALLGLLTAALRSGSIVVPILLGLFFQHIDIVPAFLIDALTFFISAALVRYLPPAAAGSSRSIQHSSLRGDLRQGLALLTGRRLLLLAMVTCMLGSFVRAPVYRFVLPLIATGALHAGEGGFKLLQLAQGIGGVVGALLAHRAVALGRTYVGTTLGGWALSGLGTALAGASPLLLGPQGLLPASAGLVLSALGTPIAYTAVSVYLQAEVPRDHVGKVSGLYQTLDMAGDYGGVLAMPLLMAWSGPEALLAAGGVLTVLFCAGAYLRTVRTVDPADAAAD